MINLEHNLTVDDLIVEYMMYKVKNGYEPQFLTSEFMNFLCFFEKKMPIQDVLYEKEKLFQRFFERKAKDDWKAKPHIDMLYSENDKDYVVKANYRLSNYDRSVINTYFMVKSKTAEIRKVIGEFLEKQPKREINDDMEIEKSSLLVGKYLAAEMIKHIWDSYKKEQVRNNKWPMQCRDINKYLLELDLAKIIGVKSMKAELLDFYDVISRKIAILYQQDKILKISNCDGGYLAVANYELLIKDYQKLVDIAFGKYKSRLYIDLETRTFLECHDIEDVYYWDEDPFVTVKTTTIGNIYAKKLVKILDKHS